MIPPLAADVRRLQKSSVDNISLKSQIGLNYPQTCQAKGMTCQAKGMIPPLAADV
jgi:hypothetical protein